MIHVESLSEKIKKENDAKQKLITRLQAYVAKIDGYGDSQDKFAYGFSFFCIPILPSRALNREANYLLAKRLIIELNDPTKHIEAVFNNLAAKRDSEILQNHTIKEIESNLRGINSSDLNAVIDEAKKFTR